MSKRDGLPFSLLVRVETTVTPGGSVSTPVQPPPSVLTPEQFGALGGGHDDTVALQNFLNAVSGRVGRLSQTYTITSTLVAALSNCVLEGSGSLAGITGTFGYALIQFLDLTDVTIRGIKFITNYANPAADEGTGVVYSYQQNVTDVLIELCTFSSPQANTTGLAFYPRVNEPDTAHTLSGLTIRNNKFVSCGRLGCIILNRGLAADQYTAATNVVFSGNLGQDLGLSGEFGMLLSLDSYGSNAIVENNDLRNCLAIGIENTAWINCTFSGNIFRDFRPGRIWVPMGFSNSGCVTFPASQAYMTGQSLSNNECLEPANLHASFIGVKGSTFSNNKFWVDAPSDFAAMYLRDCADNVFTGDRYILNAPSALYVGTGAAVTQNNTWDACTADNSAAAANDATVTFDGTGTTGNVFADLILKGTGGLSYSEEFSSSGNAVNQGTLGWDPVNVSPALTLWRHNLSATSTANVAHNHTKTNTSHGSGKFFVELDVTSITGGDECGLGVQNASELFSNFLGQTVDSLAWYDSGAVYNDAGIVTTIQGFTTGDIIDMAVDIDVGDYWFRTNGGDWNNNPSADPATDTGGINVAITGALYLGNELEKINDLATVNFGATPYTYAAPAGFGNWY